MVNQAGRAAKDELYDDKDKAGDNDGENTAHGDEQALAQANDYNHIDEYGHNDDGYDHNDDGHYSY